MPNVKSSYLWVVELGFRFFFLTMCVFVCVYCDFHLFRSAVWKQLRVNKTTYQN